jgi:3-deoxy-D-arabinoheptulosonate-7-phosphate synthase (EC 2.5.1.54)
MVVVMEPGASPETIEVVSERLAAQGFQPHLIHGVSRIVIAAVGEHRAADTLGLKNLPGVEKVIPIMKPYKLASREARGEDSVAEAGRVAVGGRRSVVVMAGPCAVENREQLFMAAQVVKRAGATILRGGAFKPRTSPYSFQGASRKGITVAGGGSRLGGSGHGERSN